MRVTITFSDSEELAAGMIERFVCGLVSKFRVRRTDDRGPYRHIYITTIEGGGRCRPAGWLDSSRKS